MTKRNEVYKCEKCGQIVEIVQGGAHPVCCNEKMVLQEEKTADQTTEKHVPVIEKIDGGYRVYVGSTEHPMVDAHYIQFIQLIVGDEVYTKYLKPGEKPEAIFKTDATGAVSAREYCNLHGLWRKDA